MANPSWRERPVDEYGDPSGLSDDDDHLYSNLPDDLWGVPPTQGEHDPHARAEGAHRDADLFDFGDDGWQEANVEARYATSSATTRGLGEDNRTLAAVPAG